MCHHCRSATSPRSQHLSWSLSTSRRFRSEPSLNCSQTMWSDQPTSCCVCSVPPTCVHGRTAPHRCRRHPARIPIGGRVNGKAPFGIVGGGGDLCHHIRTVLRRDGYGGRVRIPPRNGGGAIHLPTGVISPRQSILPLKSNSLVRLIPLERRLGDWSYDSPILQYPGGKNSC